MLIAESGRVDLHGVVTRDVVHVNSGVREGSLSQRSYDGCGSGCWSRLLAGEMVHFVDGGGGGGGVLVAIVGGGDGPFC